MKYTLLFIVFEICFWNVEGLSTHEFGISSYVFELAESAREVPIKRIIF